MLWPPGGGGGRGPPRAPVRAPLAAVACFRLGEPIPQVRNRVRSSIPRLGSVFVDFRCDPFFFEARSLQIRRERGRIALGAKTPCKSEHAACPRQPPPFTTTWSTPPRRARRCCLVPPTSRIRFLYTLPNSSCVYTCHSTSHAASCSERPHWSHRRGFAGVAPRRSLPLTHVILLYMS